MNTKDDELVLVLAAIIFGPVLLAGFFKPVQEALVSWHVLTTENVLIPIGEGAGIDLARLVIAISVIGALALLTVLAFRRRAAIKKAYTK